MVGCILVGIYCLGFVYLRFQLVSLFALSLAVECFRFGDDSCQRLFQ